ncbi:hypothetical protein LCGC14_1554460 [marine sediment metagenome]|uniref:Uncharacterized protein n=1 Tax=marine sediment metagenome TaxID=412755 RepID=A0A0F9LQ36_9ZZZZ
MKNYSDTQEKLKELEYYSIIQDELRQIEEIGLNILRTKTEFECFRTNIYF